MPDSLVRPPDMDFVNAPHARPTIVIACGHLLGDRSAAAAPVLSLPCYQALGPWSEPDAGLPWFRIGQSPAAVVTTGPSPGPPATSLADLLPRNGWLLLLVGGDHDSLALALAIATFTRSRGVRVTALLAGRPGQPFFQRAALRHCCDHLHDCPPGMDPLRAAQALWSGVVFRGPGESSIPEAAPRLPDWPGQF